MAGTSATTASSQRHHATTLLKGHQDEVLCLDHHHDHAAAATTTTTSCLLSGSADTTARLWDLRETNTRASHCIKCPGAVFSAVLGRPCLMSRVSQPSSMFARDYTVYLSVGNAVYMYDLRHATRPIVSVNDIISNPIMTTQDEINQIHCAPCSHDYFAGDILAAADDAGQVHVQHIGTTNTTRRPDDNARRHQQQQQQRPNILYHDRDGTGLATCCAFRPRPRHDDRQVDHEQLLLATGGTDCRVQLWNARRHHHQSCALLSHVAVTNTMAGPNQLCNPPFIHALSWSPSGALLAAGCGDGSIVMYQAMAMAHRRKKNKVNTPTTTLQQVGRVENAHSGAVASCVFCDWDTPDRADDNNAFCNDRLLATAGNDQMVVLWDVGTSIASTEANDPRSLVSNNVRTAGVFDEDVTLATEQLSLSGDDDDKDAATRPQTIEAWRHDAAKPNWMVSSGRASGAMSHSLFVADTTNHITIYTLR